MFAKIDAIAWHRSCSPTGQMDLLRSVPCPLNGLCAEEDDPGRVIGNSQFTYTVQDLKQPRYWYLSLVACVRNPISCRWETTSVKKPGAASSVAKQSLVYSIWLVNGAPRLQGFNTFEHQFSFETHDTAEIFLTFLVLYLILSIVAHLKLSMLSAAHTCLFLISVWLFSLSALLATIHLAVFSFDGRGLGRVSEFATLVEQWGDALFLVLLLSTAEMGFVPPTSQNGASNSPYTNGFGADVKSKLKTLASSFHVGFYQRLAPGSPNPSSSNSDKLDPIPEQNRSWPYLLCMVTVFLSVKTFFYVWALLDQDPVIDFSVWNTVPGCILLAIRFGVAFWFLATLRRRKLLYDEYWDMESYGSLILGPGIDLVRFAALFLLWIFVLPLVVFVAETSVSTLWRNKTIISVCLSANYVAACAYAYMLWICSRRLQETEYTTIEPERLVILRKLS
ncbi:unnamed protein product [Calicophoron daubneyi]|uniref:Intimal thickness related receptor IRP domain-containing protein n=1 Tax=Calicophoron daubneyi TaxID=300641 RepID=A0AAV2TBI8_CALDB